MEHSVNIEKCEDIVFSVSIKYLDKEWCSTLTRSNREFLFSRNC